MQQHDVRDRQLLDAVLLRMVEEEDIKSRSNLYHVADTLMRNLLADGSAAKTDIDQHKSR